MTTYNPELMTKCAQEQSAAGGKRAVTCSKPRMMEREDWNQRYAASDFIWTDEANRFLIAEMAGQAPGQALDMAAGEGRNSVWLAEQGWWVSAVDFSEVAIEKGRRLAMDRRVCDRIEFIEADLRQYRPDGQRFDLVALLYLQIHPTDLVPIIQRAAGAVAPGGTFLLVAHDADNLRRGYGGPQHPAMLYTAEDVIAALDGELLIEKAVRVERVMETAEGNKLAIDCLVRGKRP